MKNIMIKISSPQRVREYALTLGDQYDKLKIQKLVDEARDVLIMMMTIAERDGRIITQIEDEDNPKPWIYYMEQLNLEGVSAALWAIWAHLKNLSRQQRQGL